MYLQIIVTLRYPCRPTYSIIPAIQLSVAHAVVRSPGIYLREIQTEIVEEHEEELSPSVTCRFLHEWIHMT